MAVKYTLQAQEKLMEKRFKLIIFQNNAELIEPESTELLR
jgi:hypothetical protein